MLLCCIGLAAVSMADVTFGHEHLGGGHVVYHFHLHFGPHEHLEARLVHEHHNHQDHRREAPAPRHRDTPRRTATVATALILMQPVRAGVLAAPLADATSSVAALALPLVMRPVAQPALPRGPPTSGLSSCWKKGSSGCRA